MNEVLDRIRLIISVEGSRRISWENIEFLFEKYDLSEEERQKVLDECKKMGIQLFRETSESSVKPSEDTKEDSAEAEKKTAETGKAAAASQGEKKKGFFSRLFGR